MKERALPPGRWLEADVARLLKEAGFRTKLNPRAAWPRQTDIYARTQDLDLLIEVKDRKRLPDISDIGNLRLRLQHTASDVVGAIFTSSDSITKGARQEIESNRTREVIVFVGSEIQALRDGRASLRGLIERKRLELRQNGRVWIGLLKREYLCTRLPKTAVEFRIGRRASPYFVSRTRSAHGAYARRIPDLSGAEFTGGGTVLPLRLTLGTVEDFKDILGYMHENFGLSSNGMFSIHQSDVSWHGIGAESLVQTMHDWRKRYAAVKMKHVHHSESISYFDQLQDGWVSLSTQRAVLPRELLNDGRWKQVGPYLSHSELSLQLPGMPVDAAQFLELCRYTGNDVARFQVVGRPLVNQSWLKRPVRLDVVGTVVEAPDESLDRGDRYVTGVIARNPFHKKKVLPRELKSEDGLDPRELTQFEVLLCDVGHYHLTGDEVDGYFLQGVEVASAHSHQVIRPFGTWNKIVKRARSWAEEQRLASASMDSLREELAAVESAHLLRKR